MKRYGFIAGMLGGLVGLILLGIKEARVHSRNYMQINDSHYYEYGMVKS